MQSELKRRLGFDSLSNRSKALALKTITGRLVFVRLAQPLCALVAIR